MQIYLLTRQAIYSKQNWWSDQRAVRLCFKNRLLSSSFVPTELQSLSCRYRCALLSTENCRKKLLVASRPSRLVRTFLCNFLLELIYSHPAFLQFTNLHGELGTLGSVCRVVNCSDIRRITSSASGPRKNVVHVIRKTRVFFVCSCGMDYTACVVHQETEFWINARHCSRSMRIALVVGFRLKCFAQSKHLFSPCLICLVLSCILTRSFVMSTSFCRGSILIPCGSAAATLPGLDDQECADIRIIA